MLKLMLEYINRKLKIIGAVCKLFQAVDAVAYTVDVIFRLSDADDKIWGRRSFPMIAHVVRQ